MNSDDDFDRFLTKNLINAQPYIPDGGFTSVVMAQLPAHRRRSRLREWLILGLPCLVISLFVFSQLPLAQYIGQMLRWFMMADLVALLAAGACGFLLALLGCIAWLAREMRWA